MFILYKSHHILSFCVCLLSWQDVLRKSHNVARTPIVVSRPLADVTVAPSVRLWIRQLCKYSRYNQEASQVQFYDGPVTLRALSTGHWKQVRQSVGTLPTS